MICALLQIGCLHPCAAQAAVYRCVSPADRVQFEQFGCPPDTLQERATASGLNIVHSESLNPQEQKQLARLEARLVQERNARRSERARHRADIDRRRAQSEQLCAQARTALERLARERRRGYSSSRDRTLSEQETRWRSAEKTHC